MVHLASQCTIPIGNDGVDLGENAIRFTYVIDSDGCNGNGRDHAKVANIGFGTPIFDTYCTASTTKAMAGQLGGDCSGRIR